MRGTQSFVGVMALVWKRPMLVGIELLWRWCAVLCLGGVGALATHLRTPMIEDRTAALHVLSIAHPAFAIDSIISFLAAGFYGILPILRWFAPLAVLVWLVAQALGRTLLLRQLQPGLRSRLSTLLVLGITRNIYFLMAWGMWAWCLTGIIQWTVILPNRRGEEASLVLFAALLIVSSLLLYVVAMAGSWFLYLSPLISLSSQANAIESLRGAFRSHRELKSKLIETNLVMGIVKITLLVLAMVFSACPLPFSNVATQSFLNWWWFGCFVFWVIASDYFHVVRAAAYLRLWQAYEPPVSTATSPNVDSAS